MTADTIPPPPTGDDAPAKKRKRGPSMYALKCMLADVALERDAIREQNAIMQQAALASNQYAQDARAAVEEQLAGINQKLDQLHSLVVAVAAHLKAKP